MLDLDTVGASLPPNCRIGNIGQVGKQSEHHSLKPGTWTCTLLAVDSPRSARPLYSVGYGELPSLAFASALSYWNRVTAALDAPKALAKGDIPSLSLADLGLDE